MQAYGLWFWESSDLSQGSSAFRAMKGLLLLRFCEVEHG